MNKNIKEINKRNFQIKVDPSLLQPRRSPSRITNLSLQMQIDEQEKRIKKLEKELKKILKEIR